SSPHSRVALNAAHVVRILCENHGSLVLSELQRKICQEFKTKDGNEDELKRITSDERNFLIKEDLVVAKTSVRVCGNFKIKDGNEDLHLCKYHVCGNCSHRNCISHDLSCHNNQDLLMRMHLQYLTEANLFQLLLQNDPELLPEVKHVTLKHLQISYSHCILFSMISSMKTYQIVKKY
uniref:PARP12 winged helix domain-containing protein n=1 Tax=Denticeps clupeoides TaxID=299321 RepID=A0AAY4E800_9TELE